jgi:protein TonB
MPGHVDILEQPERIAPSFLGSIIFHLGLVGVIVSVGWIEGRSQPAQWGSPNGGGMGAVAITPVASIALPSHGGPKNPLANDTKSSVPVPVSKEKPSPKTAEPDSKAIPIPSRNAKSRPSAAAAPRDKWNAAQEYKPNQLYSTAGARANTADYTLSGGGGIGVGNNSPFGTQFGAYADLLRSQVARFWKTSDIRASHAPVVGVTFTLHRDGRVTAVRVSQRSGISALDISAQRAVMDASPFPPLPAQFTKNEAEVEFLFQLKE